MSTALEHSNRGVTRAKASESVAVRVVDGESSSDAAAAAAAGSDRGRRTDVPLRMKIVSVVLVIVVGFGSHWSSDVTAAMKSTLKKKLHINNAQYSVLEASQDFMIATLILVSGVVTDRIGGAGALLWGNAIYSIGSIILAAAATARSYKFMIFGVVVQSFGDIATKIAQYKAFCSWFSPSHGFASTIGIEHGISKLGSFVGKATANVIAERTGDFSWVYWTAVFVNLFTNVVTLVYWLFARWCGKRYSGVTDPATGDKLPENNKKFEVEKMIRLPWPFWGIVFFSLFQTCAAAIYSQNATEMAEQRFHIDPVKAGWYSAMSKYLGFFLAPMLGIFVDLFGQRLTVMLVCGVGMLLSMSLLAWGPSISGTAASFGFYAVSYPLGPTVLIDSVRTSIWYPEIFGSGYAVKVAVNNSMIIIVRIITGVIQDRDNNSYNHVVIVYVLLAAGSVVVGTALFALSFYQVDLRRLQWTKTQRLANGDLMNERREAFKTGDEGRRNRRISLACFAFVLLLIATAWVAFFWGVATGNND